MFWSREVPTYTPEDVEAIARSRLDELSQVLGEKVYATKDSLLTESRVKAAVKQAVDGPGQTTVGLLSTQIGLPKSDIESILVKIKDRFYLQGENVICSGEVKRLKSKLVEQIEEKKYVTDLTIYELLNVNSSFLEWLLEQLKLEGEGIVNDKGLIIRQHDLATFEQSIVETLNSSSKPIPIGSVSCDIPGGAMSHLTTNLQWLRNREDLKGSVRNGVFTPEQFVDEQLAALKNRLSSVGYAKISEFSSLGVRQQVESVVPGSKALSKLVFTQAYIDSQRETCINALDESGYFEFNKSLHVDGITGHDWIQLKELILDGVSGIKKLGDDTITKPSRQTVVIEKAKDYFVGLTQKSVEDVLSSPSNPDLYLNCANAYFNGEDSTAVLLSQPTTTRLNPVTATSVAQYFTSTLRLPKLVVSDLTPKALPEIEPACQLALASALEKQILHTTRHRVAKIQVYTNGLELVSSEAKLHLKLKSELDAYKATYLPEAKVSEGTQEAELLNTTYGEMLSVLRTQLAQATDMALTLHLAVLISLAKGDPPAILRASGKHVPKLLKLHSGHFPPQFMELKDAIVGKASLDGDQLSALLDFVRTH